MESQDERSLKGEIAALQKKLALAQREGVIRDALESAGVPPIKTKDGRIDEKANAVRIRSISTLESEDDRALAFIAGAAVINEAAVEARQIIMPAEFDAVGRAGKTAGVAHLVKVRREAGNLLRGLHAVFGGDDDAPVVGLIARAKAGVNNDVPAAVGVARRPVPVDETWRAEIAVGNRKPVFIGHSRGGWSIRRRH